MVRPPFHWSISTLVALSVVLRPTATSSAEPNVRALSVHGLQVGGTTTLTVEGDELTTSPKLLLPFPATQSLQPKSSDKSATFKVTLDDQVVPGLYPLRVVTEGGVSLPMILGVDRLRQLPMPKHVEPLPAAIHGSITGSAVTETAFTGKLGQRVLIEVEAQRIGSKLRPVIHLYGPSRRQVGWAWGVPTLLGDARLDATLPADGSYTITVHDVEYNCLAPGFFRLKVGQFAVVDQVYPPVATSDDRSIELLGPLRPRVVSISQTTGRWKLLDWPRDEIWTGPRPVVEASSRAEYVEPVTDLPTGPIGVSGKLLVPFEEDTYRIPVMPGTKVRFEVFAERIRSPLDAALIVRDGMGTELARSEDSPGTLDPILEFPVPEKLASVRVCVADLRGDGGPRAIYRMVVEPVSAAQPDFHLFTPTARVSIPWVGISLMPVLVERHGYSGAIPLTATGLPSGTHAEAATIPADADGALVILRHTGVRRPAAISRWTGRGEGGLERPVTVRDHPLEHLQPWLAEEIAVASIDSQVAFAIDWRTLPLDAPLVPGLKRILPVHVTRTDPSLPVRLTLLTSQNIPVANGRPDTGRAVRVEKAIELAPQAADGDLTLIVPAELASPLYDVAVQAEMLSADKKTVRAVAYTPVRRMTVRYPAAVKLTGPPSRAAVLDPKLGATVLIEGTVERVGGVFGDVTVSLAGLPVGARADAALVKALMDTFTVKLILPPTTPLGSLTGLRLSASVVPDPAQLGVRVKSRDVELNVSVSKPK